jgi:outer membrane receptor protein involved in Fe transport
LDGELEWRALPGAVIVARYNYLDAQVSGDPFVPDGTAPPNVPRHHARVILAQTFAWRRPGELEFGALILYRGRRTVSFDAEELDARIAAYTRCDLFAHWRVNHHFGAHVMLENLTDEHYFVASQGDALHVVPGAPRGIRLELDWRF